MASDLTTGGDANRGIIAELLGKGSQISQDISSMFLSTRVQGIVEPSSLLDDKKYLMERVIQLAASFPNESKAANDISDTLIKNLWDNLRHPPISYLGYESRYRAADGAGNNIMYPELGKAGSHYARSVTRRTPLPPVLPDPSTIFDAVFRRNGTAIQHPNKISSILFYITTLITHDIFRTSDVDQTKLESSSYLDMGWLYGHNAEQQKAIRTFKDGTLKPDAFSETELLRQPPGVCALAVAFNRFHNYVVGELSKINEGGRFSLPPNPKPENIDYGAVVAKRENDLFQTGRLITCGLYVNIILFDYMKTILNLNRSSSTWLLDPQKNLSNIFDAAVAPVAPQGIGNQVSVEFSLIYRWHSSVSNRDEKWIEGFYADIFPGKDQSSLSLVDFLAGLSAWSKGINTDPGQQTFGKLRRKADGSFDTFELVNMLQDSTDDVGGAFGARNVPAIMKAIDVLGIKQAREWDVATLNEVRKFFKLKPHATFLDINPDPAVAEALEALYDHPDNVELYPGVNAEAAKGAWAPGHGLCMGYTSSKAILADTVSLVRADRFYTTDNGPANLTNWGCAVIAGNHEVAGGGVMYKLLMNAFPGYYRGNSVYAMFPLTVPDETRKILSSLGKDRDYDYGKPNFVGRPTAILTWDGVVSVLGDQKSFKVPWARHTFRLTGREYMLSGDSSHNTEQREFVKKAIYEPKHGIDEIRNFYEKLTKKLIVEKSHNLGPYFQLDVVKDIANISHAKFIAHMFHIPLQGANGGRPGYTDGSLYHALSTHFAYVFLDFDTSTSFALGAAAVRETNALRAVLKDLVRELREGPYVLKRITGLFDGDELQDELQDYGKHLIERFSRGGKSVDNVVAAIIPTAAAAVATQAQGFSQLIDLYLSDEYKSHWPTIRELARSDSPEAFEKLKKYALEGLRLATPAFGLLRTVSADNQTINDGARGPIQVSKNDSVFLSFTAAGTDPAKFPEPKTIDLNRPEESYIHHGWGAHACLGRPMVTVVAATQLKVFAQLDGLRRAPGAQGELRSKLVNDGAFKVYLSEDGTNWSNFPRTKKVHFNGFGFKSADQVIVPMNKSVSSRPWPFSSSD